MAALAAAMAAHQAGRLVSILSGPGTEGAAAWGAALAARARAERLAALRDSFEAASATPAPASESPLLRRLVREISARED